MSQYDDLDVSYHSTQFSDFDYCKNYEIVSTLLNIESTNKQISESLAKVLMTFTEANTSQYYVSCNNNYQFVSSNLQATIYYQPDESSDVYVENKNNYPGKYQNMDDYVIIEDGQGSITFGTLLINQNNTVSVINIQTDQLTQGCQFIRSNNQVFAVWQDKQQIKIFDYVQQQISTVKNIAGDVELLTHRSDTDPNYIAIRVNNDLNTYNLIFDNNTYVLNQINSFDLTQLYEYFQVSKNYVNVSTMLQYSKLSLFLTDYLVVQCQYQLLHHYIVFLRLSDFYVEAFNTACSYAMYFKSNGINELYSVGLFDNTQSNLASYDLSNLLDAGDYTQNVTSCWLIQDCISVLKSDQTYSLSLNQTSDQCNQCEVKQEQLWYKDFYETLKFVYDDAAQQYSVVINTQYPQTCFELYSQDYIQVNPDTNKFVGSYTLIIDNNIPSCYSQDSHYKLYVDNNWVSYQSISQQYQVTCMNDAPQIQVVLNTNSTNSSLQLTLPPIITLQPMTLQQPISPVDYQGYLSVNLHDIIEDNYSALITITSYSPSNFIFHKYILNTQADTSIDSCFTGDKFMLAEYQVKQQKFVVRPTYTLTRFAHPCTMSTENITDFTLQANISGYITNIDMDSFVVNEKGFYEHEFFMNPNVNRMVNANLVVKSNNKQYTSAMKTEAIKLSCIFQEDSFRFINQDNYLKMFWTNDPRCNTKKYPNYENIQITSNGEVYEFDDYDATYFYIEEDLKTVDKVQFNISIGSFDRTIKTYTNIKVYDYNTNIWEDYYLPLTLYLLVIIIFYICITVKYRKLRPHIKEYQQILEQDKEDKKQKQQKQKEVDIFNDDSKSDQQEDSGDLKNNFDDNDNDDSSDLYNGIPKPKIK